MTHPLYGPPEIPGWKHVTNCSDATKEQAEREYRRIVTEILAKHGLKPRPFDVRVESFRPDPEIRWAVYTRER